MFTLCVRNDALELNRIGREPLVLMLMLMLGVNGAIETNVFLPSINVSVNAGANGISGILFAKIYNFFNL